MQLRAHKNKRELWLQFGPMDIATNTHRVNEWVNALQNKLITAVQLQAEGIQRVHIDQNNVFIVFFSEDVLKSWVNDRWIVELVVSSTN